MSSEDNDGVGMTILKGLGKLLLNVMDETAKSAMKSGDSKRMETASKYMANRQNIAGKWELLCLKSLFHLLTLNQFTKLILNFTKVMA